MESKENESRFSTLIAMGYAQRIRVTIDRIKNEAIAAPEARRLINALLAEAESPEKIINGFDTVDNDLAEVAAGTPKKNAFADLVSNWKGLSQAQSKDTKSVVDSHSIGSPEVQKTPRPAQPAPSTQTEPKLAPKAELAQLSPLSPPKSDAETGQKQPKLDNNTDDLADEAITPAQIHALRELYEEPGKLSNAAEKGDEDAAYKATLLAYAIALGAGFEFVRDQIKAIAEKGSAADMLAEIKSLQTEYPEILKKLNENEKAKAILVDGMATEFVNGIKGSKTKTLIEFSAAAALVHALFPKKKLDQIGNEFNDRADAVVKDTNAQVLQDFANVLSNVDEGADDSDVKHFLKRATEKISVLSLQTNQHVILASLIHTQMARGYAQHLIKQNLSYLEKFPVEEFYRAEDRVEWRDWPTRWTEAGGKFYEGAGDYPEGRMIAPVNGQIWYDISAFGTPFAPFDYNSGMDTKPVSREEAIRIGAWSVDTWKGDISEPKEIGFNDTLKFSSQGLQKSILDELLDNLGDYFSDEDGTIKLNNSDPDHAGRPGHVGGSTSKNIQEYKFASFQAAVEHFKTIPTEKRIITSGTGRVTNEATIRAGAPPQPPVGTKAASKWFYKYFIFKNGMSIDDEKQAILYSPANTNIEKSLLKDKINSIGREENYEKRTQLANTLGFKKRDELETNEDFKNRLQSEKQNPSSPFSELNPNQTHTLDYEGKAYTLPETSLDTWMHSSRQVPVWESVASKMAGEDVLERNADYYEKITPGRPTRYTKHWLDLPDRDELQSEAIKPYEPEYRNLLKENEEANKAVWDYKPEKYIYNDPEKKRLQDKEKEISEKLDDLSKRVRGRENVLQALRYSSPSDEKGILGIKNEAKTSLKKDKAIYRGITLEPKQKFDIDAGIAKYGFYDLPIRRVSSWTEKEGLAKTFARHGEGRKDYSKKPCGIVIKHTATKNNVWMHPDQPTYKNLIDEKRNEGQNFNSGGVDQKEVVIEHPGKYFRLTKDNFYGI